jgi:ferrochelatase
MTGRAILFLQLGGPENLDEVPRFLYRLFSDPDVIRVRPAILRKAIAATIAITRKNTSRKLYASIGGGSPIRRLTEEQAAGVEGLLRERGKDAVVRAAMNCSNPLVEDVVQGPRRRGSAAVPRSLSTRITRSTTKGRSIAPARPSTATPRRALFEIGSWPTHPLFVEARGGSARRSRSSPTRVLKPCGCSSPPTRFRRSSSRRPATLTRTRSRRAPSRSTRAGGQSRWTLACSPGAGPVEWLGPATLDVIGQLGRKGEKQVLAVPIAFVADHVETLYEIDQLFGEAAKKAGIAPSGGPRSQQPPDPSCARSRTSSSRKPNSGANEPARTVVIGGGLVSSAPGLS